MKLMRSSGYNKRLKTISSSIKSNKCHSWSFIKCHLIISTHTDLGMFRRQMAKTGDVGGSVEEYDWFSVFFVTWKLRI